MAKKYIDAGRLKELLDAKYKEFTEKAKKDCPLQYQYMADGLDIAEQFIDSLQQEQPIKVYRVENEKESKGLWRKFDGTWEPLFDMLTDGQCKDMPMEDSPIYREGGKRWFASAPSKETLQKWFSRRDLEELTAAGFTITEFEVLEYRKLSDFEYIFTRESIVNKTNINVTDIYPKEQPDFPTTDEQVKEILATHPKIKVPEKYKNPDWLLKKQEQLEVDLEKEIDDFLDNIEGVPRMWHSDEQIEWAKDIARHFYELALNARKEE